jgi:hypothetical protein
LQVFLKILENTVSFISTIVGLGDEEEEKQEDTLATLI